MRGVRGRSRGHTFQTKECLLALTKLCAVISEESGERFRHCFLMAPVLCEGKLYSLWHDKKLSTKTSDKLVLLLQEKFDALEHTQASAALLKKRQLRPLQSQQFFISDLENRLLTLGEARDKLLQLEALMAANIASTKLLVHWDRNDESGLAATLEWIRDNFEEPFITTNGVLKHATILIESLMISLDMRTAPTTADFFHCVKEGCWAENLLDRMQKALASDKLDKIHEVCLTPEEKQHLLRLMKKRVRTESEPTSSTSTSHWQPAKCSIGIRGKKQLLAYHKEREEKERRELEHAREEYEEGAPPYKKRFVQGWEASDSPQSPSSCSESPEDESSLSRDD